MSDEREYFERGKQILGKTAGGLLVRLLKAKGGNVAAARSILELARGKQDPREWLAKAAVGPKQPDMFSPASVHARQEAARKQLAEREQFKPHNDADKARVAAALASFKQNVAQIDHDIFSQEDLQEDRKLRAAAGDYDARMAVAQRLGEQADTLEERIDDWEVWP